MFGLIDHVGIAVADLDSALALYEGTFSMPLAHRETVDEQGVEAALLDVGPCHVELLRPLGPETPVGRFLDRKGPGLHHVAYRVDDIEATLAELAEQGRRADRLRAAHRDPQQQGRVRAPEVDAARC